MSLISRLNVAFEEAKQQQLQQENHNASNNFLSPKHIIDLVKFLTSFDILAKVRRWCEYHAYVELVEEVSHSFLPNAANIVDKKKKEIDLKTLSLSRKNKNNNNLNDQGINQNNNKAQQTKDFFSLNDKDPLPPIQQKLSPEQLAKIRKVIQQSPKLVLGPNYVSAMVSEDEEVRSTAEAAYTLQQAEHQALNVMISPLSALGGVILKYCERHPSAETKWISEFQLKAISAKTIDMATLIKRIEEAIEGDVLDVIFADPEERKRRKNPRAFSSENIVEQTKRRSASPFSERLLKKAKLAAENGEIEGSSSTRNNVNNNNKAIDELDEFSPPNALVSVLSPLPPSRKIPSSSNEEKNQKSIKEDASSSTTFLDSFYTKKEMKLLKTAPKILVPILFQLIDVKGFGVISLELLSDFCAAIILSTEQAAALQVDAMPAWSLRGATFSAFSLRYSKIVPDLITSEKAISFLGLPENVSTSPMASVTCVPARLVAPIPNNTLRRDFEDSVLEKKMRLLLLSQKQKKREKDDAEFMKKYGGGFGDTDVERHKQEKQGVIVTTAAEAEFMRKRRKKGALNSDLKHEKEILQNEMSQTKTLSATRVFGDPIVDAKSVSGFIGVDCTLLSDLGLFACSNTVGEIYFFTADQRAAVVCTTPRAPSSITALATCRGLYLQQLQQSSSSTSAFSPNRVSTLSSTTVQKQLLIACDRSGRVMFWEVRRKSVFQSEVVSKRIEMLKHPARFVWVHEKNHTLILVSGENQVIIMDLRKLVLMDSVFASSSSPTTTSTILTFTASPYSGLTSNVANGIIIGSFPCRSVVTTASLSIPLNGLLVCGALDGPELVPLGCVAGTMAIGPTPLIASTEGILQQQKNQGQEATGSKTSTTALGILHDLISAQKNAIITCVCDPQLPQGITVDAKMTVTVWDLRRMVPTQCVTITNIPDICFQPKMFTIGIAKGKRRCALLTDGAHALWFERPVDQKTMTVTFGNESFEVIGNNNHNNNDDDENNNNGDDGEGNNNNKNKNGNDDGDKQEDLFDDDEAIAREADAAAPIVAMFEYNEMILVVTERAISLWKEERNNKNNNDESAGSSSLLTLKQKMKIANRRQKDGNESSEEEEDEEDDNENDSSSYSSSSSSPDEKQQTQTQANETATETKEPLEIPPLPNFDLEADRDLDNSCRKLYLIKSKNALHNNNNNKEINEKAKTTKWKMQTRGTLPTGFVVLTAAFNSQRRLLFSSSFRRSKKETTTSFSSSSMMTMMMNDSFSTGRAHLILGLTNGDLIFVHPVTAIVIHTIKNIFDRDNLSPAHDSWSGVMSKYVSIEEREMELEKERTNKILGNNEQQTQTQDEQTITTTAKQLHHQMQQQLRNQQQQPPISSICLIGEQDVVVSEPTTGSCVIVKEYFLPLTGSRWNVRRAGTMMIPCCSGGGGKNYPTANGQQDLQPFASNTIKALFSPSSAKETIDISLFSTKGSYFWPMTLLRLSRERLFSSTCKNGEQQQQNQQDEEDHTSAAALNNEKIVTFLTNPLWSGEEGEEINNNFDDEAEEEKNNNIVPVSENKQQNQIPSSPKTATTANNNNALRRAVLVLSRKVVIVDVPRISSRTRVAKILSDSEVLVASFDTCFSWRKFDDPPSNTYAMLQTVVDDDDDSLETSNKQKNSSKEKVLLFLGRSDGTLSVYDLTEFMIFFDEKQETEKLIQIENAKKKKQDDLEAKAISKMSPLEQISWMEKQKASQNNNINFNFLASSSQKITENTPRAKPKITLISRYRLSRRSLNYFLFSTPRNEMIVYDDAKIVTAIPLEKLLRPPLDIETKFNVDYVSFETLRKDREDEVIKQKRKVIFEREEMQRKLLEEEKRAEQLIEEERKRQDEMEKSRRINGEEIEKLQMPDYSAFGQSPQNQKDEDDENPLPSLVVSGFSPLPKILQHDEEKGKEDTTTKPTTTTKPSSSILPRLQGPSLRPEFEKDSYGRIRSTSPPSNQRRSVSPSAVIESSQKRLHQSKTPQVMKSSFLKTVTSPTPNRNMSVFNKSRTPLGRNRITTAISSSYHHQFAAVEAGDLDAIDVLKHLQQDDDQDEDEEQQQKLPSVIQNQVATFLKDAEEHGSYTVAKQKQQQQKPTTTKHQKRPSTPLAVSQQLANSVVVDVDKRFVEPSGGKVMKKPLISDTLLSLYKRKPL